VKARSFKGPLAVLWNMQHARTYTVALSTCTSRYWEGCFDPGGAGRLHNSRPTGPMKSCCVLVRTKPSLSAIRGRWRGVRLSAVGQQQHSQLTSQPGLPKQAGLASTLGWNNHTQLGIQILQNPQKPGSDAATKVDSCQPPC